MDTQTDTLLDDLHKILESTAKSVEIRKNTYTNGDKEETEYVGIARYDRAGFDRTTAFSLEKCVSKLAARVE